MATVEELIRRGHPASVAGIMAAADKLDEDHRQFGRPTLNPEQIMRDAEQSIERAKASGKVTEERTCETHGTYTAVQWLANRWSGCPACNVAARVAEEVAARASARQGRIEWMMKRSGIVGRYASATFDAYDATTPDQQRVLQRCREYVDTFNDDTGNLWLVGPPGTGKSHLGSAIVHALIDTHQKQGLIYSGREIIRLLRSTWGKRESFNDTGLPDTEEGMIDYFGKAALLVLDEVGVQFGTDAETVQLLDVIDLRYKYSLPTVLVSNVPIPSSDGSVTPNLRTVLGDRSYDRLREGAEVLPCDWKSHRAPAKRRG